MNGIALNNQYLHEVEMLLTPYGNNTVSYLKYPPHRIKYEIEGDNLILKLPVSLALELYRTAILPQNSEVGVPIKIDNKEVGKFQVIDFRYANSVVRERDEVSITLQQVEQR